jgi:hypothetical protein
MSNDKCYVSNMGEMMKVPSVFYGTFKKVKAEVNKLLTKIKRGIPYCFTDFKIHGKILG